MKTLNRAFAPMLVAASFLLAASAAFAFSTNAGPLADDARYAQALEKIKDGTYTAAIPPLTAVLKEYPEDPDALNLMGFSLRKLGRADEAIVFYRRALARNPEHLGANEYLGELYVEMRLLDRAKERLAVLRRACDANCVEYRDLEKAIVEVERKRS